MTTDLHKLATQNGIVLRPPASASLLDRARDALQLPEAICDFYAATNGLQHEWFRIPPIHDPENVKGTWDSLERANDPKSSKLLRGETEFLRRYLVFAELSGPNYAVIQREDGAIWFSEDDELFQTDLEIDEFIATCIREVNELH